MTRTSAPLTRASRTSPAPRLGPHAAATRQSAAGGARIAVSNNLKQMHGLTVPRRDAGAWGRRCRMCPGKARRIAVPRLPKNRHHVTTPVASQNAPARISSMKGWRSAAVPP
jgi:hypothetical protein